MNCDECCASAFKVTTLWRFTTNMLMLIIIIIIIIIIVMLDFDDTEIFATVHCFSRDISDISLLILGCCSQLFDLESHNWLLVQNSCFMQQLQLSILFRSLVSNFILLG